MNHNSKELPNKSTKNQYDNLLIDKKAKNFENLTIFYYLSFYIIYYIVIFNSTFILILFDSNYKSNVIVFYSIIFYSSFQIII